MAKPELTIELLRDEAAHFGKVESNHKEPALYGVTDGKAVGTYLEHKFNAFLEKKYEYERGNSASGIDFPHVGVDLKVTSIKQPQSSCPFKSARQKIFGLGYGLLVFVYEKSDNHEESVGKLDILHTVFVEKERTADFQMTRGLRQIIENDGNVDDLIAFMGDKNLPVEEIEANIIAEELLQQMPEQGYLTISNALQWRLQYRRVIDSAGKVPGILKVA